MAMVRMRKADGIVISVTGYRWTPGSRNIHAELGNDDYVRFLVYIAELLQREFIKAIDKQRYKKTWPPLSISYLRYKQKHNLSTNIWEATSTLKNNIKIFKRGSYIVVGFKMTDTYPNTNIKINKVARYVEYGGAKLRPRPLFRKITEYIRKNISRHYEKFKKDVLNK